MLLITSILLLGAAHAADLVTTVNSVVEDSKQILIVAGANGRIYKAPNSEKNLKLLKSYKNKVVTLSSENYNITNIRPAIATEDQDVNKFAYSADRKVVTSDLGSYAKAQELFDDFMNESDKRRSECFKRAHIWSYDLWSKKNLTTEKIFIFYTERYNAYENGEKRQWGFHVAPLTKINGVDYVLDATFLRKPVTVKEWMAHFIKSPNITCPMIDKYSDYENDKVQWSRLCFIMKTPMHYFSPADLQERDKGVQRNHWLMEELQDSREMFKDWKDRYFALDTGKKTIDH
jgi:Glutaminase